MIRIGWIEWILNIQKNADEIPAVKDKNLIEEGNERRRGGTDNLAKNIVRPMFLCCMQLRLQQAQQHGLVETSHVFAFREKNITQMNWPQEKTGFEKMTLHHHYLKLMWVPREGLDKSSLQMYSRSKQRTRMVVEESYQTHVKDTTLTSQCLILTSTNYPIWSMRMEVLLGIHGVWDVVDLGLADAKKNNIVMGLLFQSILEDLVLQIRNLNTRKGMWEVIKTCNLGVDRVKEARLQTLITEFENMKMSDNDSIDAYAAKLSGIASKSTTLGEVMSKHKLVKKFLTSLPRRFVHIVAALEQLLDLETTGFEDVVGRLKAYEERVKEKDKANDAQENLLYARTKYSNRNNDSSRGRGRGSYSRGRGQGCGRGNT
nr:hypothetical protein [Tanacetum cinerariifolium]